MNFLDDICKEYGICYSLHGGTLLGAERNHHFIPWDDDIDITMRRQDFENFKNIVGTARPGKQFYLDDTNSWVSRFVVNDDEIATFVDIFIWDYISEYRILQVIKITALRTLQGMMKKNVDYSSYGLMGKILVGITQVMGRFMDDKKKYSLFHHIQTGFPHGKTEYIHKSNDSYRGCGEIFDKRYMEEYTKIELEGREYMVAREYKKELVISYGKEYLTPPDKKDRHPCHSQLREAIRTRT